MGSRKNGSCFDTIEQEAHVFALCLLMPAKMVREEYHKMNGLDLTSDDDIKKLADKFGVSITAMAVRLSMMKLL